MDIQNGTSRQLTFWLEEPPVSLSQSQGLEKDLQTLEVTSCLPILESLQVDNLSGLSGKMYPVFCPLTAEEIFLPLSHRWGTWGMGGHTECWTLSGSDWPREGSVCSLSDVLETQPVHPRFYLSAKACQGILRRAEKRGKDLPLMLRNALEAVAVVEYQAPEESI